MPKAKAPAHAVDFGKAYKELEGIIEWFEREDVDLDEGLQKFERGLQLAKDCKARLAQVENKVSAIKAKFDDVDADEAVDADDDMPVEEIAKNARLL